MTPAGRFQPPVLANTRCLAALTVVPGPGRSHCLFMLVPFAHKTAGHKVPAQGRWPYGRSIRYHRKAS